MLFFATPDGVITSTERGGDVVDNDINDIMVAVKKKMSVVA
jgi:hypothetical protein